jgi:hypothetical protein
MKTSSIACLALTLLFGSVNAFPRNDPSPEGVVRDYARTWNAGDFEAFLALHSSNVRKYRRADAVSAFELTTSGREVVKQKYQPLFAKTPRVHVEIVSVISLGEMVVTRDRVSGAGDGHVSHELTMYEVKDGLIQAIWYLGRVTE